MGAEGNATWDLVDVPTDPRFEPLGVLVNEADESDGCPADVSSQMGDIVEAFFRRSTEDLIPAEDFEPGNFVFGQRQLHTECPLNDRSRIDFSRCFSISYNSYFPRLLLPNWVQDYYSACENYRLRPGSPYGIRCHAVLSSVTGVSRIVDTFRSGKKRRNRSRFAQAGRNQSSLRDASDGAAENITFQRESAKSLTSGTSVKETGMTAIGAVGIPPFGFVIAADGRKRLDDESRAKATADDLKHETDEAQKIFEIIGGDKVLAYGVSGFVKLSKFDVMAEIKRKVDLLSYRQFDTCRKFLTSICSKINEELNEAKGTGKIETLPTLRRTEDGTACKVLELIVVGYFKNAPSLIMCSFTHSNGKRIEYQVNSLPPHFCALLGSDAVRKAIYPDPGGLADARFAEYTKPIPIYSLPDATEYVKGYVAACSSDVAREIDFDMWKITGGHIHVAQITPQRGFEWLIPPKASPL